MLNRSVPLESVSNNTKQLSSKLVQHHHELLAACKLRYQVFVEEEQNHSMINESKLEQDEYDAYCDHIIVQDQETQEVVGTYRMLLHHNALKGNGYYSETEFDLSDFAPYRPHSMELGRSCVHPDYRNGTVIQMLWKEIAKYVMQYQVKVLVGCASAYHLDPIKLNEIYTFLCNKNMLTDRFGVKPLPTHRIESLQYLTTLINEKEILRQCPPLLKGYYWLGAEIAGEPAYDPIFATTDFFIVLQTHKITKRYQNFLT